MGNHELADGKVYQFEGGSYRASLSAEELMHRQIAILKGVQFATPAIALTPFSHFEPNTLAKLYAAPGGWFDLEEARKYLWETTPRQLAPIAAWVTSEIANPNNCYWQISASGQPIGHIGLEFETGEGQGLSCNVTYFNGSLEHRGKGHVKTAAQILFDYMHQTMFARQITTFVAETNEASYRILLSCRPTHEYSGPGGNYFIFNFVSP